MSLKTKLIGNEDERAVSPVIGVILMVAITVILAAVIAAFVLDLGGSIGEEAQAGVGIDGDGTNEATVQVTSLGNADGVYIVAPNGDYVSNDEGTATGGIGDAYSLDNVGDSITINEDDIVDGDGNYNVVAYIGDSPDNSDSSTVVTSFTLEED